MDRSRESAVAPRRLVILGSTGSIGRQALEVLAAVPGCELVGLAAGSSVELLLEQAALHGVKNVCLRDAKAAADAAGLPLTVLNGIVGAAGLRATMAALDAGATLALANKESMVAGGPFVLEAARRSGSLILPVDSEHSALFQCIAAGGGQAEELLLTGSGGPFRGLSAAELAAVTPEQALKHPNWSMGPKITIDSATLMNKGLELI